jgi:membrane protein
MNRILLIVKNPLYYLKIVKDFLTHKIWSIQLDEFPPIRRFLLRYLRVILLALRGFVEDRVLLRASALTYFTLMSVVPIFAMGFGIAKGFGVDKYLENQLLENFQAQQEVIEQLINFSGSLLERTGGGLIAGIGVVVLLYSAIMVFGHIEHSFNDIWQIKTPRPFTRKFADYLSLMFIAPVLLIAASGINVFVVTQLEALSQRMEFINLVSPIILYSLRLLPYFIVWVVFTLMYIVMPNTRVKVTSGIIAGIIAGSIFMVIQWLYIDFQVGVSKYNAIYGSFAALPLFLAWLQISWLIVLFGAEISFAHQNENFYEFEAETENLSHRSLQALSLLILNTIVKRFIDGEKPYTAQEISKELKLPIRLVRSLLDTLVNSNILARSYTNQPKTPAFLPAQHIDKYTVSFIISKLDNDGANINIDNEKLKQIYNIHREFGESIVSLPSNVLVKDL